MAATLAWRWTGDNTTKRQVPKEEEEGSDEEGLIEEKQVQVQASSSSLFRRSSSNDRRTSAKDWPPYSNSRKRPRSDDLRSKIHSPQVSKSELRSPSFHTESRTSSHPREFHPQQQQQQPQHRSESHASSSLSSSSSTMCNNRNNNNTPPQQPPPYRENRYANANEIRSNTGGGRDEGRGDHPRPQHNTTTTNSSNQGDRRKSFSPRREPVNGSRREAGGTSSGSSYNNNNIKGENKERLDRRLPSESGVTRTNASTSTGLPTTSRFEPAPRFPATSRFEPAPHVKQKQQQQQQQQASLTPRDSSPDKRRNDGENRCDKPASRLNQQQQTQGSYGPRHDSLDKRRSAGRNSSYNENTTEDRVNRYPRSESKDSSYGKSPAQLQRFEPAQQPQPQQDSCTARGRGIPDKRSEGRDSYNGKIDDEDHSYYGKCQNNDNDSYYGRPQHQQHEDGSRDRKQERHASPEQRINKNKDSGPRRSQNSSSSSSRPLTQQYPCPYPSGENDSHSHSYHGRPQHRSSLADSRSSGDSRRPSELMQRGRYYSPSRYNVETSRHQTSTSTSTYYGRPQHSSILDSTGGNIRKHSEPRYEGPPHQMARSETNDFDRRPQHSSILDSRTGTSGNASRQQESMPEQDQYSRDNNDNNKDVHNQASGPAQHRSSSSLDVNGQRPQQHRSSLDSRASIDRPRNYQGSDTYTREYSNPPPQQQENTNFRQRSSSAAKSRTTSLDSRASMDLDRSDHRRQSHASPPIGNSSYHPSSLDYRASAESQGRPQITPLDSYDGRQEHGASTEQHGTQSNYSETQYHDEAKRKAPETTERKSSPPKKRWCEDEGRRSSETYADQHGENSPSKLLGKRWNPPGPTNNSPSGIVSRATPVMPQRPPHITDNAVKTPPVEERRAAPSTITTTFAQKGGFSQQSSSSVSPLSTRTATIGSINAPPSSLPTMDSRQGDADKKKKMQPVVKPAKKPHVSNKSGLGIPMRWLKPAAKPKKIVKPAAKKQTSTPVPRIERKEDKGSQAVGQSYQKPDNKTVGNAPTNKKPISKQAQPSSPLANRLVTDSEGGSTVSNNRDLLAMLAEKKQEQRVPSAIVTKKPKTKKVSECPLLSLAIECDSASYSNSNSFLMMQKDAGKEEKVEEISFMDSPTGSHEDTRIGNTEEDLKGRSGPVKKRLNIDDSCQFSVDSDSDAASANSDTSSSSSSSDESDTDEEEVMMWASKMFGVPCRPQIAHPKSRLIGDQKFEEERHAKPLKLHLKLSPLKKMQVETVTNEQPVMWTKKHKKTKKKQIFGSEADSTTSKDYTSDATSRRLKKKKRKKKKKQVLLANTTSPVYEPEEIDEETERLEREEGRRIKEEAKPLTAAQIRAILGEDDLQLSGSETWVRRSVRQPCKDLLNSKPVRALVDKLKNSDPDVVVLKMKKYVNDPNAPPVVLDAALDALEENINCEVLYIQVSSIRRVYGLQC
jgi:hypothetical protein